MACQEACGDQEHESVGFARGSGRTLCASECARGRSLTVATNHAGMMQQPRCTQCIIINDNALNVCANPTPSNLHFWKGTLSVLFSWQQTPVSRNHAKQQRPSAKWAVLQAVTQGRDVWRELLGAFEGAQTPLTCQEQMNALIGQRGSSKRQQQLREAAVQRLLVKLQVG